MASLILGIAHGEVNESRQVPFLSFPLECGDIDCDFRYTQGAHTPSSITSVLDHQMDSIYEPPDGVVVAFNGETGVGSAKSGGCYPKDDGSSFNVLGLYLGTNDGCLADQGMNYDNHPGYDYRAKIGTPVKAAASGVVVNILNISTGKYGRCVPRGIANTGGCDAWGYVGIDHGNGYITQYGHLKDIIVKTGESIVEGQQIGLSGDTSPPEYKVGPHLHFEVLKKHEGKPYGYAFVDPYGWEGKLDEDYLAKVNEIENTPLWKFDPRKIDCLLNWAEGSYSQFFSPQGTTTDIYHPFSYRHYQNTNFYLGVSSIDNFVYYVGSDKVLQNAGDSSQWLSKAGCNNTISPLYILDGQWFSTRFQYGFEIKDGIGIATLSNSPKFATGDVVFRLEGLSKSEFQGEQVFTDGEWYKISGAFLDENTLEMTGGGYIWIMSRQ